VSITLSSTTESTNFRNNTANKVTVSVSWSAGDIITVWGFTGDNARTLTAPTATGLTFSNQLTSNVSSRIKFYLWTAAAGSSGSSTVASTLSANENGGIVVKVWTGTGTLSLGTVSSLGSSTTGAPSVAYTVAATGSVIDGAWGNWNPGVTAARTYRTTNLGTATEDDYYDNASFATVATWHNASTTATGSQTIGLSSPTANAWLCAGIEIEETGGGGGGTTFEQLAALGVG
jgi:hypothetical protein